MCKKSFSFILFTAYIFCHHRNVQFNQKFYQLFFLSSISCIVFRFHLHFLTRCWLKITQAVALISPHAEQGKTAGIEGHDCIFVILTCQRIFATELDKDVPREL